MRPGRSVQKTTPSPYPGSRSLGGLPAAWQRITALKLLTAHEGIVRLNAWVNKVAWRAANVGRWRIHWRAMSEVAAKQPFQTRLETVDRCEARSERSSPSPSAHARGSPAKDNSPSGSGALPRPRRGGLAIAQVLGLARLRAGSAHEASLSRAISVSGYLGAAVSADAQEQQAA